MLGLFPIVTVLDFRIFLFVLLINVTVNLQCTEEAHRPVDCGTVVKWILKNSAESENMNWYRFLRVLLMQISFSRKID